uniref:Large ribosomal subunit protein mL62 n=1 Tax=Crocodylus porosus TaxID=8502 RepID=A0A7M4E4P5_CROPO
GRDNICRGWGQGRGSREQVVTPVACFAASHLHPQGMGSEQSWSLAQNRLSISYCRSSGPGGQNVNKVNSKAEVRFHLASADWIPEDVRQKIAVMHKNKISKSGDLIINSEVSRYQMRNRADCLQKIRDMILEATEKPQTEVFSHCVFRVEKMNRERLRQKKLRSAIKQDRSVDFD